MIQNLKSEFKVMIKEYEWMDPTSKRAVSEKVDSLTIKIGYPDFILNDTHLTEYYSPVNEMYFLII